MQAQAVNFSDKTWKNPFLVRSQIVKSYNYLFLFIVICRQL